MEDECDDDPFDDPFGDALHVSSGLQTTRDSSAVDDEWEGGENSVKGVVERVDVRIRGEFLRYKDAREFAVCITLSRPPPGPFDLSGVTEDTGWPRSKAARYAWIEKSRVEDFVNGLWDQDGRRFSRQRSKNERQSLWSNTVNCYCECGPEDCTLTVSQVTAVNLKRATKRAVGTSKKCGCKKRYVFSELNADAVRIVSPQTVSVGDLVRVSWDPAESHAAACARSQSVAMLRTTRAMLQRMIAQHPTYTAHKIQECWREHVKKYQMQQHGWKDEYQFHEYARAPDNGNFLADIDFNIPVATINNIRENIRGTKWRYHENETKSLFRLIAEKAGSFVIKFKPMELLDDPQRCGGKLALDMRPCYWCEATFDNSNDLFGHMLDCPFRDIDWNNEKVREWCSVKKWQSCSKFTKDVARLEAKASYCEEMAKVTDDFLRSVHGNTKLDVEEKMNSVMSPVGRAVPSCTGENTEDIELEMSLRFLRGGPDAWKLKSFDVQLSKEDMDRIDDALGRFLDEVEKNELVAQIQLPFSATVTRGSLQTLRPNSWLNDEVINFFMSKHNLYAARHTKRERLPAPVVRCANSFFFTKLNAEGYSAVKTWSTAGRWNTHAWLESKYVFVPINIGNAHWMCSVVDMQSQVIYIIDSYNDEHHDVGDKLLEWICEDGEANEISVGPKSAWKIVHKVLPKQMMQKNGSDCGMFVLAFSRDLCMRMSISPDAEPPGIVFTSESVADKRRRAVHEILKMGIQGRIDTRPNVACSPNEKTMLQQVVDVKSPLGKQFYRDGATEKLPRVRIKQGCMEKQMVVYQPFILVLMSPAQERLLWKYGNHRCIQMDSTFNITKSKFSTFTLIARHPDGFYMPCAFFITSDERQETIVYCLQVIRDRINRNYTGGAWCPSTFMVDCCWAETNAIKQVFPKARVVWCQFHVFQAFNRNITSKLAEKQGEKASIAISQKERGQIKKMLWKLVKETFQDDDAWDKAYTGVLEFCDHKQKEIDKKFGDAAWTTWRSFRNYLETQWGRHRKLWARHFRSGLTYGMQETTGSIESFHGRWKARLTADGKGDIRSRRMDWLIHHLQHEIIPRYCDKVCQAETSKATASVMKAMFRVLDDAKTIDDIKDVEKKTTDDEGTRFSVTYGVNYSGEVHNVSGLETLEDCALDRDHTQVKCSCALGRNGQLCPPKVKAMLMENNLWTFKALNIPCKPDDVQTTEIDVDMPTIQDDVEASQPTHRRSLGPAFDNASVKSRWAQMTTELTQIALDPEFTFEPGEAAHITDTLTKLQRFMTNLKTHREMSQSMSKNSKMDGDGVIGMSNLVAVPMRGAARDTALTRKRGWHEKMVDEHKRKASKGEQISIKKYLS